MKTILRGALAALLCSGCLTFDQASRDRGSSGFLDNVPVYRAPQQTRCAKFSKGSSSASACDEGRYLGEIYVRRLATSDEVCLDGGFGDKATAACGARAAVVDTAPNRVLLEVREAKPDSKWFNRELHQFWFEEGALVDLYLADHGY